MAGISAYYYVGGAGGFMGSDGLNGKDIEIAVWEGNRRALVANHLTYTYRPMFMKLNRFVPYGPDDEDQARIALILFASNLFEECPSYEKVKLECEGVDFIDFNTGLNVPKHFYELLEESRQIDLKDKVNMYFAILYDVNL